jgi:hypothetical protein
MTRRGLSLTAVSALGLATALALGCGRQAAPKEEPISLAGRYRVEGETVNKTTGERRAITGMIVLKQEGDRFTSHSELRTVLPGSQATPAEVLGTGEGTIEGNIIKGEAHSQLLRSEVPGVDAGFVGMPRAVTARVRSTSLGTVEADGSIRVELENVGEAGAAYEPTRTTLTGKRLESAFPVGKTP